MAWADTLLDASFRGITFDCLRTQDSVQRDTASHEYPYLDGADVEDLGRKARHITMSAVFFGKDYENRLQTFIKELDKPGHGELIHPVFGSIKQAQLTDYQVGHDADNPDYCTVELTFVEATPGNPFFVQQLPAQKAEAVSQLAATSRANGIEAFAKALDGLKSIKGNLSRLNALRDMMTGTLGAIRSQVQGIIGTTLDLIDYPRAFASDVMSLVSGIADLRGFDVGVIQSDWKSLVGQFDNVVALPSKVSAGSASTGGSSGSGGTGGGVVADAKPIPAKPEDIALVTALVQISAATTLAETAGQILAAEAEQPTLSPQEVEHIANDVRDTLQQVIEAHRDLFSVEDARPVTEALKDTALGVQEAAVAVIEALPPLVTRTVDAPGNLHLVAFRWYGDYTRAQELARLNPKLTNPNALQAGDTLYAYAR
ncbi:phage tail/DNA circulation protein [Aquitalea magnusonii]|uniref:Phage tail/DNA circulation protein n=1 Tax=Aquitalea magnusonii TaxID=332411 RepID=A0A3G9GJH4_9NEIS|nr:DNA circularization N-terminal domain-containing protein [Aquitalea magnusonii]BBF86272.1 phage tail/DNA circulation protein [Aquitalea magnusonii]